MKTVCVIVTGTALLLLASGTADASQLFTAVLVAGEATHSLRCRVTNVSKTERSILVEIVDASGGPMADNKTGGVAPLVSADHSTGASIVGPVGGRCRITVQGAKSTVRGLLAVQQGLVAPVDIAVVPAQ